MSVDPKKIAEWKASAAQVSVSSSAEAYDDMSPLAEAVPSLITEVERLEAEVRAKDELVEIARQEIARLKAVAEAADAEHSQGRAAKQDHGLCAVCRALEDWHNGDRPGTRARRV